ncbi:MAG: hypothetical protein EPN33_00375 [Acidobacteria bacterium]|nr:MAG: hypothetical protein EPN33_00375 [Acidobacteriota bacterium]
MTADELLASRSARKETLRPRTLDTETLIPWVGALSFPTLAGLGAEAAPFLEEALADFRLVELWLWPGELRYCRPDLLGYVYVAAGDRHPLKDYQRQAARNQLSWLAAESFTDLLASPTALTAAQLRDIMGAERTSALTIEHALQELARRLKIVRCGRAPSGDALWRPLVLALPEVPKAIDRISQIQAVAALISHHLATALCETEVGLAAFFSPLFSRTRIHEALSAFEVAGTVVLDNLEGRPAWRLRQ